MNLPREFYDMQARAASEQLRAEQSENREQVLQLEFIDMRNRAELAEKSALDLKAVADHLQRQRAETEAAHSRIYDEKNKEIAELQARMTRYERLLEDAERNAETLRKAYDEAKNRADSTTGKDNADLQKQNWQLFKDLNDKHDSWRNTQVRLEKAIKERDEYAKVAADLQKALAISEERNKRQEASINDLCRRAEHPSDCKDKLMREIAELTRQREEYKEEAITLDAELGIRKRLLEQAENQIAELTRQRDEAVRIAEFRHRALRKIGYAGFPITTEGGAEAIMDGMPHPNPPGTGQIDTEKQRLRQERDNWERTAADFHGNAEFYRGIVHQIGDTFGIAARTSYDGSVQEEVLALRVPELVRDLRRTLNEQRDRGTTWKQRYEEANRLLRLFGHDITGTNPVTKDEQGAASNPPGAGKTPLVNDPQAPSRAEIERTLDACERENDRLRLVIDSIQNILSLADEQ